MIEISQWFIRSGRIRVLKDGGGGDGREAVARYMLWGLVKWNQDVCVDCQVPMSSRVLEKEGLDFRLRRQNFL